MHTAAFVDERRALVSTTPEEDRGKGKPRFGLIDLVTGSIELHDTDGTILPTKAKVWLCRCGASTKKPFCDGTHSKIGFQAAARAVPGSAEGG